MPNVILSAPRPIPAATSGLRTDACPHPGRPGLVVTGELDIASVRQLQAAARDAGHCASLAADTFVLDLAGVTFLDVAGLSALNAIQDGVAERGWALHFTAPAAPGPRRLLDIAHRSGWLCPPWGRARPHPSTTTTAA